MITLSRIRDEKLVFDEDIQKGILERFETSGLSWEDFCKPKAYEDFAALIGTEIVINNKVLVFKGVRYYEPESRSNKRRKDALFKTYVPKSATVYPTPRFFTFAGPRDVPFPIDPDLQITCEFTQKGEKHVFSERVSYFQLAGLLNDGRKAHWSDSFAYHAECPQSTALVEMGIINNWLTDPLYRVTPQGEPKVDDVLKPGMLIQINGHYRDKPFIIERVNGPYYYKPVERDGEEFEYFSISLIDPETGKQSGGERELVAINGEIKHLFMTNDFNIEVLGIGYSTLYVPNTDEDEDDDIDVFYDQDCDTDELVAKPIVQPHKKHLQLSLF